MRRALAVAALLALAGCLPVRASSECQARINNCLRNCVPPPATSTPVQLSDDSRSPCERDCEALCN
jgi:hypothetical protein